MGVCASAPAVRLAADAAARNLVPDAAAARGTDAPNRGAPGSGAGAEARAESNGSARGDDGVRRRGEGALHESDTMTSETAQHARGLTRRITWGQIETNEDEKDLSPLKSVREARYLYVLVLEGRGLLAGDRNGQSDPYVKLWLDGNQSNSQCTPVEPQTRFPCWNGGAGVSFWFRLDDTGSAVTNVVREAARKPDFRLASDDRKPKRLRLRVYDSDFGGLNSDLLGCANVDLTSLGVDDVVLKEVALEGQDESFPVGRVGDWGRKQIIENGTGNYGSLKLYLSIRDSIDADPYRVLRNSNVVKQIMQAEFLYVTVIRGEDLMPADKNGRSDPYVVVRWNKFAKKTSTKYETLKPYWGSDKIMSFPFPLHAQSSAAALESKGDIILEVYDADSIMGDDILGYAYIKLPNDLAPGSIQTSWIDIHPTLRHAGVPVKSVRDNALSSLAGIFSGKEKARVKFYNDHPHRLGRLQIRVGMGYVRIPRAKIDQRPAFRPKVGRVSVEILSGHNLPKMDVVSESDAYVEISYENIVETTSVRNRNANPVWMERVDFDITEITSEIRMLVKDDDSTAFFEGILEHALGRSNHTRPQKNKVNEVHLGADGHEMSDFERAAAAAAQEEDSVYDDIIGKTAIPMSYLWNHQESGQRVEYKLILLGPEEQECAHHRKGPEKRSSPDDIRWMFEPHRKRDMVLKNGYIRIAVTIFKESEGYNSQKKRLQTMRSDLQTSQALRNSVDGKDGDGDGEDPDELQVQSRRSRSRERSRTLSDTMNRLDTYTEDETCGENEPTFIELYGGAPKLHDDVQISRLRINPDGVLRTTGRFIDVMLSPFRCYALVCIHYQRFVSPLKSIGLFCTVLFVRLTPLLWDNLRIFYPLILTSYLSLVSEAAVAHRISSGYERHRSRLFDDDLLLRELVLDKITAVKKRRKRERESIKSAEELAHDLFESGHKTLPSSLKPEHDAKTAWTHHRQKAPRSKLFVNKSGSNSTASDTQLPDHGNNHGEEAKVRVSFTHEADLDVKKDVDAASGSSDSEEYGLTQSKVAQEKRKAKRMTRIPIAGWIMKKYQKYLKALDKIKGPYVKLSILSDRFERFANALMFHDAHISTYLFRRLYFVAIASVFLLVIFRELFRLVLPLLLIIFDERNLVFALLFYPTLPVYNMLTEPIVLAYDKFAIFAAVQRLQLTPIAPVMSIEAISRRREPSFYEHVSKAFRVMRDKYIKSKKLLQTEMKLKALAMDAARFQRKLLNRKASKISQMFSPSDLYKSAIARIRLEGMALKRCLSRAPTKAEVLHREVCEQLLERVAAE